jgi:hypothetical protein
LKYPASRPAESSPHFAVARPVPVLPRNPNLLERLFESPHPSIFDRRAIAKSFFIKPSFSNHFQFFNRPENKLFFYPS